MYLYALKDYEYVEDNEMGYTQWKETIRHIVLLQHTEHMSYDDFEEKVRRNRSHHNGETIYDVANSLCLTEGFIAVPMISF